MDQHWHDTTQRAGWPHIEYENPRAHVLSSVLLLLRSIALDASGYEYGTTVGFMVVCNKDT